MVSKTEALIVSGVLGSICAVLVLLLVFLIRALRSKNAQKGDRRYPPGVIVQGDVPEFIPGTTSHKVQTPISSPKSVSVEHLDSSAYGPDMSKFFGQRRDINAPNSISMEYLNTPVGSPAFKIRRRRQVSASHYSLPTTPKPLFGGRHLRVHSDPSSPRPWYKQSQPQSTSSEDRGKLEFSYYYDEKSRQLHVNVIQAFHLPGDETLESYVTVTLKPDEMNWRKETKFVFNSTDPLFDETFVIPGFTHTKIRECSLHFLVMNNADQKAIGQLHVSLADLQSQRVTSKCLGLSPIATDDLSDSVMSEEENLGELLVALCHNPSEGKLTVGIRSAKGLPGVTKSGKIDPYVKIRVYFCGERIYKKKTSVKHDDKEPSFEEKFDFVVTRDKMPQTSVILRIYHHGRRANVLSRSSLVGVVFLGYQFELYGFHPFMLDYGARHWASVIEKPHLNIEEWHPIQAFPH